MVRHNKTRHEYDRTIWWQESDDIAVVDWMKTD